MNPCPKCGSEIDEMAEVCPGCMSPSHPSPPSHPHRPTSRQLRVTLTHKANGRYYLGFPQSGLRALERILRTAEHFNWATDCMGTEEPGEVRLVGRRIFKAVTEFNDSQSRQS